MLAGGAAVARKLFDRLAELTADAPGVTRVAYGPGEAQAHELMRDAAAGWRAEVDFDAAGNQFITLPGADRERRIVIGSHLDSVPHGGNYDGAAGVILGLALQAVLVDNNIVPPFDLTVACLRAEESCWFPHSYIGSKTALGRLESGVLDTVCRRDTGASLAEHMRREGFSPEAVARGASFLQPRAIAAYIEPHIEQAPSLVAAQLPVGLVTGIRGSFRYRQVQCLGEYAHSGAMPRALRRDAVLASARLIEHMGQVWTDMEAASRDVTVTFGELGTDPSSHSFSKVPGWAGLCLDVRSLDSQVLADVEAEFTRAAAGIGKASGTHFDLGPRSGSEPAIMSPWLLSILEHGCHVSGVPVHRMASGAGHDAATFAAAGVASAMLFMRNRNGSHNPDEHLDLADFDVALDVLFQAVQTPAEFWVTS